MSLKYRIISDNDSKDSNSILTLLAFMLLSFIAGMTVYRLALIEKVDNKPESTQEAEVGIVLEVDYINYNAATIVKTNIGNFPLKGYKSVLRGSKSIIVYKNDIPTCMKFDPEFSKECYQMYL